jgi:small subunit ribosomal protein S14
MAKKSMVAREERRKRLVAKYAEQRARLREILKDPTASLEAKMEAQRKLQQLPRDSCPARVRNRCKLTGRPRGVYRKFGLGRNKLRELAMRGDIPGITKASW